MTTPNVSTSLTPVGPVIYQMRVGGLPVYDWFHTIELRQCWGKQDLFILQLVVPKLMPYKTLLKAYAPNAPVEILWGRNPGGLTTWYGYVNHRIVHTDETATAHTDMGVVRLTYILAGTSKVMLSDVNKNWVNISAPAIAQQIAANNSMRSVVTVNDWMLDNEMQASESDFEFLNRLADKVGYRFWVSGGTLYFIDPIVLLEGQNNFIPQYTINMASGQQDTAVNFRQSEGDMLPGSVIATREIYGIRPDTFEPFVAKSGGGNTELIRTDRLARDPAEGALLVGGAQSRAQFWRGATVRVYGYTLLYPGKVIRLEGAAMPDGTQGDWIVTGAVHHLKQSGKADHLDVYWTDLEIIHNAWDFEPVYKRLLPVQPELVQCVLVNNVWQSVAQNAIAQGVFTP